MSYDLVVEWNVHQRLRVDGGPEQLFTAGTSGSVPAPWISNAHQFNFLLYDASTGQLLDFINVFATP